MKFSYKLGVIGYGNMSTAIIEGALKSGLLKQSDIIVFDIDNNKREALAENNIKCADSNIELVQSAKYILLAIKPQLSKAVFSEIENKICNNIFISIMAGVKISYIKQSLGNGVEVCRCMPNTPCKIGYGMNGLDNTMLSENDAKFVYDLFKSTGEVVILEEKYLHAVTSISGSGPAYVYYFINGMIKAGVENGLSYDDSKKLTLQTFLGATKMIESQSQDIEQLIDMVCSKGGTTIQAIDSFKQDNVDISIINGIKKCYNRSIELSEGK